MTSTDGQGNSGGKSLKSKLFSGNSLTPRDEIEEKLEKCHGVLSGLITGLSEREIHDTLNQVVSQGTKEHDDISLGLLYIILTDSAQAPKAYRDLAFLSRDGFKCVHGKMLIIASEKLSRLLDGPRTQYLWLLGEMMKSSIPNTDNVVFAVIKQIAGGDIRPGNIWLAENTLSIFQQNKAWLEKNGFTLAVAVYCYLRLLEDHDGPQLKSLKQAEIEFCTSMLRERFTDCQQIGRDLIRQLQSLSRIPEFTALWKDLLHRPTQFSPQFTGIQQLFNTRTSRKILASRLTQDMENKINFLLSKVRFGQQKRYQDWFYKEYFSRSESQSLIPDLVRFICGVIHPPNEVLCSDIIPRWAVLGWLYTSCQSPISQANMKLALFYDWLFFSREKDNIMNIGDLSYRFPSPDSCSVMKAVSDSIDKALDMHPSANFFVLGNLNIHHRSWLAHSTREERTEPAALLMYHSVRTHPNITCTLLDFICRMTSSYSLQHINLIKQGIASSFRTIVQKRVVSSLLPIIGLPKIDRELKTIIKDLLPEFFPREPSISSSDDPPSPRSELPGSSVSAVGDETIIEASTKEPASSSSADVASLEAEVSEEAAFSDDDEHHIPKPQVKEEKQFKPIDVKVEETITSNSNFNIDVRGEDITELEEFQNLDNVILKDNILKLKSESSDEARCDAMETIVSNIESLSDFDEENAASTCICLSACLAEDLSQPCLPTEMTSKEIEESLEKPQHVIFRSICASEKNDMNTENLYTLLNGIHEIDRKIGYHFLYFLRASAEDDDKLSIYEDYASYFKDRTFKSVLTEDLRACHDLDWKLLMYLIRPIIRKFPSVIIGNRDVIRMIAGTITPTSVESVSMAGDLAELCKLQELISDVSLGKLQIIGENQVGTLLDVSLGWTSFEQFVLWQLIIAEETPAEMIVGILPSLRCDGHPEAMTHLLLTLRHESPTADIVRPLLCMETPLKITDEWFSTCLMKYWCKDEARELAQVLASLLTKQASSGTKRRNKGSSSRNNPTVDQILAHLDQFRVCCSTNAEKGLFRYEALRAALEYLKTNIADSKVRARYQKLFDACLEVSERSCRKRVYERASKQSRRRQVSESPEDSESEEDEEGDLDDEEEENDSSDSSEETTETQKEPRTLRPPTRKRRKVVRHLHSDDDD